MASKIAVDLGTANTAIIVQGKSEIIQIPTVLAVSTSERKVLSVGRDALDLRGKTPKDIVMRHPVNEGVIVHYQLAEVFLRYLLRQALGRVRVLKPSAVVAIPSDVSSVEERALLRALSSAGIGQVQLVNTPLAAAMGAGLPIDTATGNAVVDMGAGKTEVGVMTMGGISYMQTVRLGGYHIDRAIRAYLRSEISLEISMQVAERLKCEVASAMKLTELLQAKIVGRSVRTGKPQEVLITSDDLLPAVRKVLNRVVEVVHQALVQTPSDLHSDIAERGIALTGGGAMLRKVDDFLTQALGLPVFVVDNAAIAPVNGLGELSAM